MLNPVPTGWSMKSRSYLRFHAPVQVHTTMNVSCTQGGSQAHCKAKGLSAMQGLSLACSMAHILAHQHALMVYD